MKVKKINGGCDMEEKRIYRGWNNRAIIMLFTLLICMQIVLITVVGMEFRLLRENQHLRSQVFIMTKEVVRIEKKVNENEPKK